MPIGTSYIDVSRLSVDILMSDKRSSRPAHGAMGLHFHLDTLSLSHTPSYTNANTSRKHGHITDTYRYIATNTHGTNRGTRSKQTRNTHRYNQKTHWTYTNAHTKQAPSSRIHTYNNKHAKERNTNELLHTHTHIQHAASPWSPYY